MKKSISLSLAGIILLVSFMLVMEPNLELKTSRAQGQFAQSLLVVGAFLIAGAIVIYVWKTNTAQKMRWLVLNDDDLAGNLTPVATNYAFVGPQLTMALPVFRVYTDSHEPKGFWKVTEIPPPTNGFVPNVLQFAKVRGLQRTIVCYQTGLVDSTKARSLSP